MAGLKLKLRPEEQILINGAVLQNGKHQVELTVKTPDTKILRLRDAIHPDDVNTPVKRVCYIAQIVVAGETTEAEAYPQFVKGVHDLMKVFLDAGSQLALQQALIAAEQNNFYKAMQCVRKLINYEAALFLKYQAAESLNISSASDNNNPHALQDLHQSLMAKEA